MNSDRALDGAVDVADVVAGAAAVVDVAANGVRIANDNCSPLEHHHSVKNLHNYHWKKRENKRNAMDIQMNGDK